MSGHAVTVAYCFIFSGCVLHTALWCRYLRRLVHVLEGAAQLYVTLAGQRALLSLRPGVSRTPRRIRAAVLRVLNLVRVYNCTSIVASCSCITVLLRNSTFLKYILSDFSFDDCSESPASRWFRKMLLKIYQELTTSISEKMRSKIT